ncbi:hypothetical protein MMC26_005538 [Xylographa opegraphella]|nr:hypothetical protein [Xylographa opegraphella]
MPSSTSPHTHPNTLPPGDTFDIIPPLHALLARLPGTQAESTGTTTLLPKDLATEAAAIKIKIQKARVAVQVLPDVERSVAEQQAEIGELEERIREQERVLREIAEAGRRRRSA